MDAFDQLAWVAARDVLTFEKKMPGLQDRTVLRAAIRVLRILANRPRVERQSPDSHGGASRSENIGPPGSAELRPAT